jgi:hypothetical protein
MQSTDTPARCPDCGACWPEGATCQDRFHQMLAWEFENPPLGEVHHLMVLSYYLQHAGLYSPAGLAGAKGVLVDFLVSGVTPERVRQRDRAAVDSETRKYKITGTPAAQGAYSRPIQWPMTAAEVIGGGVESYRENVRAWARSILGALEASSNLA